MVLFVLNYNSNKSDNHTDGVKTLLLKSQLSK